ncbi:hypothetical protein [Erythrobacter sp. MTPC3]|uniref:hypothetical protein n=1 Tax=Erythrobacter sp. MTPC3 TaxID=3056564 RepID=UPI0036F304F8
MKNAGWVVAFAGSLVLGGSIFVETQVAPLIGALMLSGGLLYSTLLNALDSREGEAHLAGRRSRRFGGWRRRT